MTKNIILIEGTTVYEYENVGSDFTLTYPYEGGENVKFYLYGGYDTDCVEEFLYSKELSIPKYNMYSERDECLGYEEFDLCNKWYQGDILNDEYFLEKLEEYKESIKPVEEPEEKVEEKTLLQQVIDFYIENIIFTLPVTIILVSGIIFLIIRSIRRRKERVKLDFNFKA